jgi:hypothetical protein
MNVEQWWNETGVLGEEIVPMPLRLAKIPHAAYVIMQIKGT